MPTQDPPAPTSSGPPLSSSTIFVSDASAEADRLSSALRGRGYAVVDVPLSLLVARVAVQRPAVILVDIDADGALDTVTRLRDVPGASGIDLLFIGEPGRTLAEHAEGLRREGSGSFVRPVDPYALVAKIEALAGPPVQGADARSPSSPPPSIRGRRVPTTSVVPPSAPTSSPPKSPPPMLPTSSQPPPIPISSVPAPASDSSKTHDVVVTDVRAGSTQERMTPPRGTSLPPVIAGPLSVMPAPGAAGSASERQGSAPPPLDGFGLGGATRVPHASLSPEVEKLLRSAEERLGEAGPASQPPSPEDEVEAVLPADVLAALDEPLDGEHDEEASDSGGNASTPARGGTTGTGRERTGAGQTNAGRTPSPPRTGAGLSHAGAATGVLEARRAPQVDPATFGPRPARETTPPSDAPPTPARAPDIHELETPKPPRRGSSPPVEIPASPRVPHEASFAGTPTPPPVASLSYSDPPVFGAPAAPIPIAVASLPVAAPPSSKREAERAFPEVLGPGDVLRVFATAVARRTSGALCIETEGGIRRIVVRDGDIVTAASGLDDESLLGFLVARGDLPREIGDRLRGKLPAFGRHAGAALIAHGHLGQDQLWPVLRAHAEWILASALLAEKGTFSLEEEPPGRLKAEPSVFGGATGAEVLVEVTRRVIPAELAIARLGGARARIADGPHPELFAECALSAPEAAAIARSKGGTVGEAAAHGPTPELATVLYVLSALGVVETLAAAAGDEAPAAEAFDPLDAEALRARVRARLALVEEADYFALLGVPRNATAYEIRRAYLELRRAFEPSRVLTAATADLADDVRLILEVLDEAHDVLRDSTRRERYRRAIDAGPPR